MKSSQIAFFVIHSILIVVIVSLLNGIHNPLHYINTLGYPYFLYSSANMYRYFQLENNGYQWYKKANFSFIDSVDPVQKSFHKVSFYYLKWGFFRAGQFGFLVENNQITMLYQSSFKNEFIHPFVLETLQKSFQEHLKKNPKIRLRLLFDEFEIKTVKA